MKAPAGETRARTEPNRPGPKPCCCHRNPAAALAALLGVLLLGGCSTFNHDWCQAAKNPTPLNAIQGRWEGRWISEVNGHSGNLRCLMTCVEADRCQARFRATYGQVLHFSYAVPLAIQQHFDGWEFSGEENLGKLAGGVYYYEGRASPTNLFSTYRSKCDRGTFVLHRLE